MPDPLALDRLDALTPDERELVLSLEKQERIGLSTGGERGLTRIVRRLESDLARERQRAEAAEAGAAALRRALLHIRGSAAEWIVHLSKCATCRLLPNDGDTLRAASCAAGAKLVKVYYYDGRDLARAALVADAGAALLRRLEAAERVCEEYARYADLDSAVTHSGAVDQALAEWRAVRNG